MRSSPKGPTFKFYRGGTWALQKKIAKVMRLARVKLELTLRRPSSLLFRAAPLVEHRGDLESTDDLVFCAGSSHRNRLSPSPFKAERCQLLQLFLLGYVYSPPSEAIPKLSHTLLASLNFPFMTGCRTCVFLSSVKSVTEEGRHAQSSLGCMGQVDQLSIHCDPHKTRASM